jgi:hypothetical protein
VACTAGRRPKCSSSECIREHSTEDTLSTAPTVKHNVLNKSLGIRAEHQSSPQESFLNPHSSQSVSRLQALGASHRAHLSPNLSGPSGSSPLFASLPTRCSIMLWMRMSPCRKPMAWWARFRALRTCKGHCKQCFKESDKILLSNFLSIAFSNQGILESDKF